MSQSFNAVEVIVIFLLARKHFDKNSIILFSFSLIITSCYEATIDGPGLWWPTSLFPPDGRHTNSSTFDLCKSYKIFAC